MYKIWLVKETLVCFGPKFSERKIGAYPNLRLGNKIRENWDWCDAWTL